MTAPVGIVGAGAWGTALGISLSHAGLHVALWGRDAAHLAADRQNVRHLPDIEFPENLTIVQHLEALSGCSTVLLTVPAQTIREICRLLLPHIEPECRIVICAKGIELATGRLLSEIVAEEMPRNPVAVLSGPSFAAEVALGKPTAATIAARDRFTAAALADQLSNPSFRLYHSTDIVGVQMAGALKNVVAIACGIVTGVDLGENARAALMTRGLAEISRLATRLGGRGETFLGMAGLGDLALSCASMQSRNFALGYHVGHGASAAGASLGMVVEGIATAEAVLTLANHYKIDMPVASTVHAILSGALSVEDAIPVLMMRPLRMEFEE